MLLLLVFSESQQDDRQQEAQMSPGRTQGSQLQRELWAAGSHRSCWARLSATLRKDTASHERKFWAGQEFLSAVPGSGIAAADQRGFTTASTRGGAGQRPEFFVVLSSPSVKDQIQQNGKMCVFSFCVKVTLTDGCC